jgi:hypothetical protein
MMKMKMILRRYSDAYRQEEWETEKSLVSGWIYSGGTAFFGR